MYALRKNEDLHVIAENASYIVVSKDFDIHINSDNPQVQVTLQTQLQHAFPHVANDSLHFKFHFCHRLDYATSGLICIAKTKPAAAACGELLRSRQVAKVYVALLRGVLGVQATTVRSTIGDEKEVRVVVEGGKKPRQARTDVLLLQTGTYGDAPASKVLLSPYTGRRHQLRAHAALSLAHPVIGDYTYAGDGGPPRMMLHALHLSFAPNGFCSVDATTEDPFGASLEGWKPLETFRELSKETIQAFVSETT